MIFFFYSSTLKAFADDKLNVDKMAMSLLDRLENTVGKGENAGYQHFFFSHSVFQGLFLWGLCGRE